MQYSSVRAVSAAAYAGRVPYWRAYSTEEAVPEETVSGEEPAAAAAAAPERVGTTGGPFRVMVTGVPTEVLNRDVRVFLGRAGHVCWIRRVRAEHNDGNARPPSPSSFSPLSVSTLSSCLLNVSLFHVLFPSLWFFLSLSLCGQRVFLTCVGGCYRGVPHRGGGPGCR